MELCYVDAHRCTYCTIITGRSHQHHPIPHALFQVHVDSKVRANAETPADARQAKEFGAEGIGLVRTEHMFFDGQRIVAMRQMILATDENDRRQALEKLLVMQREDIIELFKIMDGMPVTCWILLCMNSSLTRKQKWHQ